MMLNGNDFMQALYEHYEEYCRDSGRLIQFFEFYRWCFQNFRLTYFDGFLFVYDAKRNEVHVTRQASRRSHWFNLETMQKYFDGLPSGVTAPLGKTCNKGAARTLRRCGFNLVGETSDVYLFKRG